MTPDEIFLNDISPALTLTYIVPDETRPGAAVDRVALNDPLLKTARPVAAKAVLVL